MNNLRIPLFNKIHVQEDSGVSIFHFFSIHLHILLLTKPFDFTVKRFSKVQHKIKNKKMFGTHWNSLWKIDFGKKRFSGASNGCTSFLDEPERDQRGTYVGLQVCTLGRSKLSEPDRLRRPVTSPRYTGDSLVWTVVYFDSSSRRIRKDGRDA